VTRFFGGQTGTGTGGTGGGAGDAGATCNGVECPPPPAAAAGLAVPCCQTNQACGFKIPSLGQDCLPPSDADATTTDTDCPNVTWQGKTLPGCCLPDGKTCGAVESLVGTGCLDATLFGVAATVDCDGNPVGSGGTGGTGTGGTGTGGTGTGGTGTGGTGTGGTGTGGTGACQTCATAVGTTTGDATKICAGAEATKLNALKTCAKCFAEGGCWSPCQSTLCSDKPVKGNTACNDCLVTNCGATLNACLPADT
jgi:hypothetical protein